MKLADTKTKGVPAAMTKRNAPPDTSARRNYIATAAYRKAQVRGVTPGHALADWLAAEAGCDELEGD